MNTLATIKDIKGNSSSYGSNYFHIACKITVDFRREYRKNDGAIKKIREGFLLDSTGWLEIFITDNFYRRVFNKRSDRDILNVTGYAEVKLVDSNKPLFAVKDFIPSDDLKINDIYYAIENNDIELVKERIKQGTDIECRGYMDRGTPLMAAAEYGRPQIVRELIKAGVDVNAEDWGGRTVLMNAARKGCAETFNLLIENGADIFKRDELGVPLLHYAIWGNNMDIINWVIERMPSDIHTTPPIVVQTALILAAKENLTDLVHRLIAMGVDTTVKDWNGRTYLRYLRETIESC